MEDDAGASLNETYDHDFYRRQSGQSVRAAQLILPHVVRAVGAPRSVLDIGCGVGTWLHALRDQIPDIDILGIDHPDVPQDLLMISRDEFVGMDLRTEFDLGSKFDLAISVEVAEHIDSRYASVFIDNLTRHSDTILFSAAVPGQGGNDHVNERWPSYWINLFAQEGFLCADIIRPEIWGNVEIPYWYRQNIMLFTRARLTLSGDHRSFEGADLVHPELLARPFRVQIGHRKIGGRRALHELKKAVLRRLGLAR